MAQRRTRESNTIAITIDEDLNPSKTEILCNPNDEIQFTTTGTPCVVFFKEFLLGFSLCEHDSAVIFVCDGDFITHFGIRGKKTQTKSPLPTYRIQGGSGFRGSRKK